MRTESVILFESSDATMVRAVERALELQKITFRTLIEKPNMHTQGPKKTKRCIMVAPDFEARAKALVEPAVVRRARVKALTSKPQTQTSTSDGSLAGEYGLTSAIDVLGNL